ncbi:MAG: ATPase [Lentisphaerae bacterium]|nr:ATPase [Lentisphaerota bacterium]MBT4816197.1 ATPase [Lentisphaerota bacterium]MBT5609554.1 ATPase [Lentisphaerota bacterium]MBT7058460.1 ATPase [Lentisphaerota bacterium]MBT7843169.1 ATPase [Lentisphaerota bacterium]
MVGATVASAQDPGSGEASAGAHVGGEIAIGADVGSIGGFSDKSAAYLAIAWTMGVACMSAAYAVGKVGAAALGAAAEKPELLNKALPFVGLGEGIAVLGMLISFLLWMKL